MQGDRNQRGLPPGETRRAMPTRLEATADWGAVVRVHRRHGTEERLLSSDEIRAWAARVRAVVGVEGLKSKVGLHKLKSVDPP
jgi:hypothetical protein